MSDKVIQTLNAAPDRHALYDVGFRMSVDDTQYYIIGAMFMAKSKPDEVCHPTKDVLAYQCKEGQRFVEGCHLLFFDAQGAWAGWYTFRINETASPAFCNAMPAMGVYDKARNQLLVTMQYFLINDSGAKKISELGSGWHRMTTLFTVKEVGGKIEVEQDDRCLGNPNRIDTIPEARKRLRACEKSGGK